MLTGGMPSSIIFHLQERWPQLFPMPQTSIDRWPTVPCTSFYSTRFQTTLLCLSYHPEGLDLSELCELWSGQTVSVKWGPPLPPLWFVWPGQMKTLTLILSRTGVQSVFLHLFICYLKAENWGRANWRIYLFLDDQRPPGGVVSLDQLYGRWIQPALGGFSGSQDNCRRIT